MPAPIVLVTAPPIPAPSADAVAWITARIADRLTAGAATHLVFAGGAAIAPWAREAALRVPGVRCVVFAWDGTVQMPARASRWAPEGAGPAPGEHRALVAAWALHRERAMVRRVAALALAGHPARVLVFDLAAARGFDRVGIDHMTKRARSLGLAVDSLRAP